MSPDEPDEYHHGCGSPRQCQMAEVMAGYKARAAATGKSMPSEIAEFEGHSKSEVGPLRERARPRRRR